MKRILLSIMACTALASAQDTVRLEAAKAGVVGVRAQRIMEMRGRQFPVTMRMVGVVVGKGLVLTGPIGEDAQNIRVFLPGTTEGVDAEIADSDANYAVLRVERLERAPIKFAMSWKPAPGQKLVWIGLLGASAKWTPVAREAQVDALIELETGTVVYSDPPFRGPVSTVGGLVLNGAGEAVGIVMTRQAQQQGGGGRRGFRGMRNQGMPVIHAADKFAQYLGGEIKRRGVLGINAETLTEKVADAMELKGTRGVVITQITPGSGAAAAGLKAQDVITTVAGQAINDMAGLQKALHGKTAGTAVKIVYVRMTDQGAEKKDVDVTLKAREKADKTQRVRAKRFGFVAEPLSGAIRRSMQLPGNLQGVHVRKVTAGTPAAMGRPTPLRKGDVILKVGAAPITDGESLKKALAAVANGKPITLYIRHGADTRFVEITPEAPE